MIDGTKFSSWKDFALYVMDELDATHDETEELKQKYESLKDDYKEFKIRVYTVIAIIIIIVGAFELSIRIL